MAKATAKSKTTPKTPTRKELAEYFQHEKRIEHFARLAGNLKRLQKQTEATVLAYVRAKGGRARCLMLHGYRLSIDRIKARVEWKTELLKALAKEIGKTKSAKAAARILAAVALIDVPHIEPPAA